MLHKGLMLSRGWSPSATSARGQHNLCLAVTHVSTDLLYLLSILQLPKAKYIAYTTSLPVQHHAVNKCCYCIVYGEESEVYIILTLTYSWEFISRAFVAFLAHTFKTTGCIHTNLVVWTVTFRCHLFWNTLINIWAEQAAQNIKLSLHGLAFYILTFTNISFFIHFKAIFTST